MTKFPMQSKIFKTTLAAGCAVAVLATAGFDTANAQSGGAGKQAQAGGGSGAAGGVGSAGGQGGGKSLNDIFRTVTGVSDDSDRPEWAGSAGGRDGAGGGQPPSAGSTKGDLFGDLWVIARDEDGIPLLTPEGFVQPLDINGDPVALDEEGHPVDETAVVEVEIGRLNVSRAPTSVIDRRADEVIAVLESATAIATDAAGRLVLTVDGEEKTIDSPLENLAIYISLMTDGSIAGVGDLPGTEFDYLVDGVYTAEDLQNAGVFLAAATDKTGTFTTDEIAYIDAFLGINIEQTGDVAYSVINYDTFTYDRSDTYGDTVATLLVQQPDGSFVPTEVNIYDAVFGGVDTSASGTLDAFAVAADDARQVVNFIHEYEVPVLETVLN